MARPLHRRAPNPPAVFVGREDELQALEAPSPVTVVWGPGGVGKSALLAAFLASSSHPSAGSALWFRTGTERFPNALLLGLLRSLSSEERGAGVGEAELASLVIDLIDAGEHWVVIDDLHRADEQEVSFVLNTAATYLRRGRLFASSRIVPNLTDAATLVAVGALPDQKLSELAAKLRPQTTESARGELALAARGSPWHLRLLAAGKSADVEGRDLAMVVADDPFLRALASLEDPLPHDVLKECGVPVPSDESVEGLAARGIIDQSYAGLRLHDVTRGLLGQRDSHPFDDQSLATSLIGSANIAAVAAGLAILLRNGWLDEIASTFETRSTELVDAGYGEELCSQLASLPGAALADWRVRIAAAIGATWAIRGLKQPPNSSAEVTLAWSRLLRLRGEFASAYDFLTAIDTESASPSLAFEIGLERTICHYNLGRLKEALALERKLVPANQQQAATLHATIAMDSAAAGEFELAIENAETALDLFEDDASLFSGTELSYLVEALALLGKLPEARELCRAGRSSARSRSAEISWLQVDAALSLSYDLARCEALLDQIDNHGAAKQYEVFATTCRIHLRRLRGDFGGDFGGNSDDIERLIERCLDGDKQYWTLQRNDLLIAAADVAMARGTKRDAEVSIDTQAVAGRDLAIYEARYAAHWGTDAARSFPGAAPTPPQDTLVQIARAEASLDDNIITTNTELLEAACQQALDGGYHVVATQALAALCELSTPSNRAASLVRAAHLEELSQTIGSSRFETLARLHLAVFDAGGPDWLALEQVATMSNISPAAARRARWMLGHDEPQSRVEAMLLGDQARASIVQRGDNPTETWGIDGLNQRLWCADSYVELGAGLLIRLITALATAGSLDKERLIVEVWEEPEYHPLKHDGRLKNAIRKLRGLVEEDPKAPTRIVTTSDGYGIGPSQRVRFVDSTPG